MPKAKVNTNIEERLLLAQVAITNVLNDSDLRAALARFGYDADRLQQGSVLRESLQTLYHQQRDAYGDMFTANDDFWSARQQVEESYMRSVKVARVALEHDRGAVKKLDLAGKRKRSLAGRIAQMQQFYTNALAAPAILSKLATVSVTQAMLEEGKRHVDALAAHNAERKQFNGGARSGTKRRNDAMVALGAWMSDFVTIARVALKDQPQFLAKLGIAALPARATVRTPNHTATSEAVTVAEPAVAEPGQ
jgi:hypothetical protein